MKRIFACLYVCFSLVLLMPQLGVAQDGQVLGELSAANQQVNINSANAETLALALDGVGMAKAQDIVAFREQNGEFKTVDDLALVKGVGPATIERNRNKIVLMSMTSNR